MPLLKLNELAFPSWSELDYIELLEIKPGSSRTIFKISKNEIVFICSGSCTIKNFNASRNYSEGETFNVDFITDHYLISAASEVVTCVRICGEWKHAQGNHGIFRMTNSSNPVNKGDKSDYDYLRKTEFDNHYHDCDEYWIITDGRAKVVTDEELYEIGKGDCIATKAGVHHDILEVYSELKGVYFETSLKGKKRTGHLWEHTHGKYEE